MLAIIVNNPYNLTKKDDGAAEGNHRAARRGMTALAEGNHRGYARG